MGNRITKLYDDLESVIFSNASITELEKLTGITESNIFKYRTGEFELEHIQYLNALTILRIKGLDSVENLMKIKSDVVKSLNKDHASISKIARDSNLSRLTVSRVKNGVQKNPKLKSLANLYTHYYIKRF